MLGRAAVVSRHCSLSERVHRWPVAGCNATGQVEKTAQVTANARGHFKTDPISLRVQSQLPVKDVRYVLTCSTRNPRGQESEATTVEFTR